jgi:hypothetical protein
LDYESFAKHTSVVSVLRTVLPRLEEQVQAETVRREAERKRLIELEQKKATLLSEMQQHEEAARRMREEIESIEAALAKPAK